MTFSVPRPWRSHWRPAVPFMRRAGVRLFFFSHCARFALGLSSVCARFELGLSSI